MITVEKAIKESKTRNAVGVGDKKPIRKKILIGVLVVSGVYLTYKFMKGKKSETIKPTNV